MCSVVDPCDFEQRFVYHRQPSSSDFSLLVFLLKSFMKHFFSRGGYFHYRPIQPQDGALLLITTSTFRPLGLVSDQSLSCEVLTSCFGSREEIAKLTNVSRWEEDFLVPQKPLNALNWRWCFFSVHFFWQATASASPKTRRSPPTSRSWWVSTSRTASWTCCTTNGTRWCPVGNAASPWRR